MDRLMETSVSGKELVEKLRAHVASESELLDEIVAGNFTCVKAQGKKKAAADMPSEFSVSNKPKRRRGS